MKVFIKPYIEQYHDEVIKCLRRNFNWMQKRKLKDLEEWLAPLWNYNWKNSNLDSEFKRGVVILNEKNDIVGYLGFIYSLRNLNGRGYRYLTPSYWAIDEGYRVYLFKVLKQIFKEADVIGDFTPMSSVEKILKTVFKFNTISSELYQFLPVPYLFKNHILISKCNECDLSDTEKKELYDHRPYGVKCVRVRDVQKKYSMIIFYKVFNATIKQFIPVRCIQILKISDRNFLHLYTHEIVWKLQKHERALLQCDSLFFKNNDFTYPLKRIKCIPRQFLNKKIKGLDIEPDFLYSELAMLNDKSGKHYLL